LKNSPKPMQVPAPAALEQKAGEDDDVTVEESRLLIQSLLLRPNRLLKKAQMQGARHPEE
jgi:hypothetical protein